MWWKTSHMYSKFMVAAHLSPSKYTKIEFWCTNSLKIPKRKGPINPRERMAVSKIAWASIVNFPLRSFWPCNSLRIRPTIIPSSNLFLDFWRHCCYFGRWHCFLMHITAFGWQQLSYHKKITAIMQNFNF